MADAPLRRRLAPLPESPFGAEALERLKRAAAEQQASGLLDDLLADAGLAGFLAAALGDCPFLLDLADKDVGRLGRILEAVPEDQAAALARQVAAAHWADKAEAMAALRIARQELALTVGLADLGGAFDLDAVTDTLSHFADACLDAALGFALADAGRQGQWQGGGPESCGLAIIAMGKYGAHELNYSSDIDIVAFYDPEAGGLPEGREPSVFWVRIVRLLVSLLQERTADGFVFRVDLRLRPDPGATAVAISIPAALLYYESMGQNWERAALIKARASAGDRAAGERFLTEIVPFIWRKYLDFAAIADIHSIKRQVHAHRGHGTIRVAGHDIKRGRGGIREIEMFAQTQQLIAGGRDPDLRGRGTRETLHMLERRNWIIAETRSLLDEAYVWLRTLEHRLQMVRDEQTHAVPSDREELARIARLMGFSVVARFEEALRRVLSGVAERYSELFEDAPALSGDVGSLVFTGGDDDPDTLKTLAGMGYAEPSTVTSTIRAWHFGRFPATRSTKARERLTEITPALLQALAETGNPDAALRALDSLLKGLPAGVQLFSLLASNPDLLKLLALILGSAPRLAETFARRPHVVDALIDPAFYTETAERGELEERLRLAISEAKSFEDALDRVRRFAGEQRFLIATRLLTRTLAPEEAGFAFSDLAEVVLAALLPLVEEEFARQHGHIAGARSAILAMGRLGSREMTAGSDLDLIVIYDSEEGAGESDGRRPLAPTQYYARLTQRLVAALSAPTAEGVAYPVDLRLRPSGRAGPLATHERTFERYQSEEAWTWEHMALARARCVAGDASLSDEVEAIIERVLAAPRDPRQVGEAVRDMRAKIQAERSGGRWDLKLARGGLVDVEFAAQFALLTGLPRQAGEPVAETLRRAAEAGAIGREDGEALARAGRLQGAMMQGLRAAEDRPFRPEQASAGLKAFLVQVAEMAEQGAAPGDEDAPGLRKARSIGSFAALETLLADVQEAAAAAFGRLVGGAGVTASGVRNS
jgi:[glutamine synthetase] adenylyltransferase / [glutamine synthetase]-adenylyl-L-tyrosine phosphorylase